MGGQYLVRLLKGGVRHAALPPVKEYDYSSEKHLCPHDRREHARRWICGLSERIQGVLGDRKQFKGSKHCDLANIVFRWICVCVSKLQHKYNNAVLLFRSFNTRQKHIQGVQLQHSKQSAEHCNKFKHWISGSRILIPGGDSYAAI